MPQIRHKGTVFAGSPYDPLKHYVEEETYEADKAYTEADIAKILGDIAEEEEETATKAHTIGELILFNKKLYKVSTAIAIGDSIVDGTNVTETDIATEFALCKAEDKSIKDALTQSQTVETDTFTCGVAAYKVGRLVFLSFESVVIGGSEIPAEQRFSSLSGKYCPITNVSFLDPLNKQNRIVIAVNGYIYSTTALNANQNIRGFVTYISAS